MAKPKLSDVHWLTVRRKPVTTCEPPEGTHCYLEKSNAYVTHADAKRHALENPGHHVVRETVSRTCYGLDAEKWGIDGHRPFPDDGLTYCGWDGHNGCGESWPCSAVRAAAGMMS